MEAFAGTRPSGFAVVDVETTGFCPGSERIVELGVVLLDGAGTEVDAFATLLDPGCDPGPTHIHGISGPMVDGAPTFPTVHPFLAEQLSGRVLVGHNVDQFDLAFLRAECRRAGGAGLVPGSVPTVDTLAVAQYHLGLRGRARLVDCCTYFGLSWLDHHTALADARVTAALFGLMRGRLGDEALGLSGLQAEAAASTWPGASRLTPAIRERAEARAG